MSCERAWPWPAPADDGGAKLLTGGTRLPDVSLSTTQGRPINLARHIGRAIVFVYPYTGTPGHENPPDWDIIPGAHGSTPEAEGFRDSYAAFRALGFDIFGLSGQTSADQSAFATRSGLPFALLSDHQFKFADALNLPRFETGGVRFLTRITFVARDGVIEQTVYPVHPPDRHARVLLATVSES